MPKVWINIRSNSGEGGEEMIPIFIENYFLSAHRIDNDEDPDAQFLEVTNTITGQLTVIVVKNDQIQLYSRQHIHQEPY